MRTAVRNVATAFTSGAAIALAFDLLLQVLTRTIRFAGGPQPPWWARDAEYIGWIVLGMLLWLTAPVVSAMLDDRVADGYLSRRTLWSIVGTAMLVLPVLLGLAQLAIIAIQLSAGGRWGSEGDIFLSGAYYGAVLVSVTPWIAAGAILRGYASHLIEH
jgi:hypothetical protein